MIICMNCGDIIEDDGFRCGTCHWCPYSYDDDPEPDAPGQYDEDNDDEDDDPE